MLNPEIHVAGEQRTNELPPNHVEKELYRESEKEVFHPSDKQVAFTRGKLLAPGGRDDKQTAKDYDVDKEIVRQNDQPQKFRRKRICGLQMIWWGVILIAICLVVGVIIVALVMTVGPASKKACKGVEPDVYEVGGALCPAYRSKRDIFNGTDMAIIPTTRDEPDYSVYGNQNSLWLFVQDHTGAIKQYIQESNNSMTEIATIATDARNATRIAVLNYQSNLHVFYIDGNDRVREKVSDSTHKAWINGYLNALELIASDSEAATLQACPWDAFSNDTDYHSSISNSTYGLGITNPLVQQGIRLFFATSHTNISQYSYVENDQNWKADRSWTDVNARAGLGCRSGNGTTSYVYFLDAQNNMNFYWKDTNTSMSSTSSHPINQWTKAPLTIPDAHPSTPIVTADDYIVFKTNDTLLAFYNLTWSAENTTFGPLDPTSPSSDIYSDIPKHRFNISAMSGETTNMKFTVTPWEDAMLLFYQDQGYDVTGVQVGLDGSWGPIYPVIPDRFRDD